MTPRFRLLVLPLFVACGAPPHADILVLETHSAAIQNGVLVQSVGIESYGGTFTALLQQGCRLPCLATSTFTTSEDSQTVIRLHVLRGDTGAAAGQHSLAHIAISGFPPAARGTPQVEATFSASGDSLSVSAWDAVTGVKYAVTRNR